MSQFLDTSRQKSILKGEPEEFGGLLFYPITMEHYSLFCGCESALTLRQSTLPAIYATKSFVQAMFSLEIDMVRETGEQIGIWSKFVTMLCLSLRIPFEFASKLIKQSVDAKDNSILTALEIAQYTSDEEKNARLTPSQLSQVRTIIARQNGRELPDESENAELVQAEKDIHDSQGSNLIASLDGLIASVASNQHIRMVDVYDWTVYEFELKRSAIARDRGYIVYGSGEMSGMVKFKNGNPYPSIFYDREMGNPALISAAGLQNRMNGAVQAVDSLPMPPNI